MTDFETVVVETDVLILGGGMAACGAAVETAHWAKKLGLKVALVDKAAMDRSGAVAMGLSAINQYVGLKDGQNTMEDYCLPYICSKSGACRSGKTKTAAMCTKVAGS